MLANAQVELRSGPHRFRTERRSMGRFVNSNATFGGTTLQVAWNRLLPLRPAPEQRRLQPRGASKAATLSRPATRSRGTEADDLDRLSTVRQVLID